MSDEQQKLSEARKNLREEGLCPYWFESIDELTQIDWDVLIIKRLLSPAYLRLTKLMEHLWYYSEQEIRQSLHRLSRLDIINFEPHDEKKFRNKISESKRKSMVREYSESQKETV
jgi:hypothetical protein